MGCQLSRPARRGRSKHYEVPGNKEQQPSRTCGAAAAHSKHTNTAATSASQSSDPPARKKLDPQNFMFSGLESVTQVKLPGAVQGQQFIIDNCKDCTLVVLDHCAAVTIDDCTNCRILIGPTESSVFMRDCTNCTLAAITRQLRCRDCTDCSLLLLCRTRPIIESSSGMAFGCYDAPYAGLAAQMATAKLSPFHNFWSDVYDFTPAGAAPAPAAAAGGSSTPAVGPAAQSAQQHLSSRNWQLLPEAASVEQMLGGPALPQDVLSLLGSTAGTAATVAVCADAQAACSCSEPAGKPQEQEQLSTSGGGSSSSSATGGAAPVAKAAGHGTAAAVRASSPGAASSCNPVVPEADRMCVIRSGRCSIGQQESDSRQVLLRPLPALLLLLLLPQAGAEAAVATTTTCLPCSQPDSTLLHCSGYTTASQSSSSSKAGRGLRRTCRLSESPAWQLQTLLTSSSAAAPQQALHRTLLHAVQRQLRRRCCSTPTKPASQHQCYSRWRRQLGGTNSSSGRLALAGVRG